MKSRKCLVFLPWTLCCLRIELAVGSLPMPSLFRGEEEGVLQTCQLLELEAEPRIRGLPITGSQSPGPNKTKQKQTAMQC